MADAFLAEQLGYGKLWDRCEITASKKAEATKLAEKIVALYPTFEAVEKRIGVPKQVVGVLSLRESDLNLHTHLHNGDPLTARTYHVPKGRPPTGSPPFSWDASANDALTMQGLNKISRWSIERVLYECERYNGRGYIRRGENSPYNWSWTNLQQRGKFTGDGKYDAEEWDTQPGCAAILKALIPLDPAMAILAKNREGSVPPEIVNDQTKRHKGAIAGTVAGTAATAGEKTATNTALPDKHPIHSGLENFVIGGLLIGAVVAVVLLARRTALIKQKWEGLKL